MTEPIICRHCKSNNLAHITGDDEPTSIHYGRVVCRDCNKWIKWIPKPKPSVTKATEGKVSAGKC